MDLFDWHAVDAPFTDPDDWLDALQYGVCSRCGGEAYRGLTRWWHVGDRCRFPVGRPVAFVPVVDEHAQAA